MASDVTCGMKRTHGGREYVLPFTCVFINFINKINNKRVVRDRVRESFCLQPHPCLTRDKYGVVQNDYCY